MMTSHRKLRSTVVSAVVALGAIVLPGCIPTAWLPDSSGFIYVKPTKGKTPADPSSGQLVHFDLKTKTSRVVINDIGPGTMWPAVSGDGKRIAVSKFKTANDKSKTVQFVIYDMQGKPIKQSKEFAWTPATKESFAFTSAGVLFWARQADLILVSDFADTAIYNVAADSIKLLEKTVLAVHGGSPIRPDGKGFLGIIDEKAKGKTSRLAFIDWTGAEQTIDTATFDKTIAAAAKGKKMDSAGGPFMLSLLFPSGWDDNTAWVGFRRDKLTWQVDTVKKTASISPKLAAMMTADRKGEPLRFDFAGDISVHVTEFSEALPGQKGSKNFNKVAIINHKTGKQETVLAKAPSAAMFSPSPDGNYVSIGLGEILSPEPMQMHILVISKQGQLVSNIAVDPAK